MKGFWSASALTEAVGAAAMSGVGGEVSLAVPGPKPRGCNSRNPALSTSSGFSHLQEGCLPAHLGYHRGMFLLGPLPEGQSTKESLVVGLSSWMTSCRSDPPDPAFQRTLNVPLGFLFDSLFRSLFMIYRHHAGFAVGIPAVGSKDRPWRAWTGPIPGPSTPSSRRQPNENRHFS